MATAALKAVADNVMEFATLIKFIKKAAEEEKDKEEDHGTVQPSPSLPTLPLSPKPPRETVKRKAEDGDGEKDEVGEVGRSKKQPPPPPPPGPPKKKKKSGKKKSGSKKDANVGAPPPSPREAPAPAPSVSTVTVSAVTTLGDGTTMNAALHQRAPELAEMDDGHRKHAVPHMLSLGDTFLTVEGGRGMDINEEDHSFIDKVMQSQ